MSTVSTPANGNTNAGESTNAKSLGPLEKGVAAGLVVAFLAFIITLIFLRGDSQWDRLVYLFGGLEALVFAAGGALFGTSIQRTQTKQAQQTADAERERADANADDAMRGRGLAALIRAKRDQRRGEAGPAETEGEQGRGARPGVRTVRPNGGLSGSDLEELGALADQWFPPGKA